MSYPWQTGSMGWRRRAGVWVAVAIAAMIVTAASASAAMPARAPLASGPPLLGGPHVPGAGGKFAGYLREGVIRSIGASWLVPRVAENSRTGLASTWIAAQAPGSAQRSPFIQIGISESQSFNPLGGYGQETYRAFWSDTELGFGPVYLFDVRSGDPMTASMRLAGGHWTLRITDLRSGAHRTIVTRQETRSNFNYGLWIQEDVTDGTTNAAFPYPDISGTQFSKLRLDGTQPSREQVRSTWMALPGGYLGPSALRDGAFSIVSLRLGAQGAAYLRIAGPVNAAVQRFDTAAQDWTASTPIPTVQRVVDALVPHLARALVAYRNHRWPAAAAPLVRQLEDNIAYQVARLPAAARTGTTTVEAVFAAAGRLHPDNSAEIRRLLGIEQLPY